MLGDELLPEDWLVPEESLALGVCVVVEERLSLVADSAKAGCIARESAAMLLQSTTGIIVFFMVTSNETYLACAKNGSI